MGFILRRDRDKGWVSVDDFLKNVKYSCIWACWLRVIDARVEGKFLNKDWYVYSSYSDNISYNCLGMFSLARDIYRVIVFVF